ncbi:unnamed protein product, partial [marine sediment metagenome]
VYRIRRSGPIEFNFRYFKKLVITGSQDCH